LFVSRRRVAIAGNPILTLLPSLGKPSFTGCAFPLTDEVGPGIQISDFATSQALEPPRPHGQNKGTKGFGSFLLFLKISVNVFVGVEG